MTDRRFLIILVAVIIVVTTLPYVYGYVVRPEGALYTGVHQLTPGDTATYYAFMEQSAQGEWLFTNLYTTESQERILFSPIWLILGKIQALLKISPVLLYQLARILLIPLFIWIVFRLIRYLIPDKTTQRVSMLFISFAGGLGFVFFPLLFNRSDVFNSPVDSWVPEAIPFLSMYHSPLLLVSWSLLIASLYYILRLCEEPRLSYGLYAGLLSAGLFLIHPFYVPTVWAVGGVWVLIRSLLRHQDALRTASLYVLMVCIGIPVLLYFYWISKTSFVFKAWSSGNILESPNPVMYMIGFGLLLPLAIIGAYRVFNNERLRYVSLWLVVGAALLYVPLDFQRRLVEGLFIPIAVLAAIASVALYKNLKSRFELFAIAFCVVLAVLLPITNIEMVFKDFYNYTTEKSYPHYIPADDARAARWMKDNTEKDAAIFSTAYYSGNFIPAYTGRYVFVGHGPQTLYVDEKLSVVESFFQESIDNEDRARTLREHGIDYIFWGEAEQAIGAFNPFTFDLLKPVFTAGGTTVFRVSAAE